MLKEEGKEEIAYDDFQKLEFKVGEVVSCEKAEKSEKLLVMRVRIGRQTRQIVSGIQKFYTPEQMVGKKVMVLVNLKPAKLAGYKSEGMLLSAETEEGRISLMTTDDPEIPAGSSIL